MRQTRTLRRAALVALSAVLFVFGCAPEESQRAGSVKAAPATTAAGTVGEHAKPGQRRDQVQQRGQEQAGRGSSGQRESPSSSRQNFATGDSERAGLSELERMLGGLEVRSREAAPGYEREEREHWSEASASTSGWPDSISGENLSGCDTREAMPAASFIGCVWARTQVILH